MIFQVMRLDEITKVLQSITERSKDQVLGNAIIYYKNFYVLPYEFYKSHHTEILECQRW